MNPTVTITKTITQPTSVIDAFADRKGYMTEVVNTKYVPAVGNPTIDDLSATPTVDVTGIKVYPQIPNPDYVAEVGTQFIPNPQTRVDYVSALFDEFVAEKFFGVYAAEDARAAKLAEADALVTATIDTIKSTIVTS